MAYEPTYVRWLAGQADERFLNFPRIWLQFCLARAGAARSTTRSVRHARLGVEDVNTHRTTPFRVQLHTLPHFTPPIFTTMSSNVHHFKLVLLGDTAVGKSCLVVRFVRDEFFEFQEPTIGGRFFFFRRILGTTIASGSVMSLGRLLCMLTNTTIHETAPGVASSGYGLR